MNIDFSKVNFESILIGAFAGLLLKSILDRILIALKLNRQRKVIFEYSNLIGLDKSAQYIHDLEYIKKYILAEEEDEINDFQNSNYAVDAMPTFTSAIFKSFTQDDLRRIAFTTNNYIIILDILYSIDFLKDYMPLQLWEKYHIKVRDHFESKEIENEVEHFKECGYLKRIAKEAVIEIDLKRDRAMATHKQFHHLVIQFKGWDLFWIIKYFIKQ